EVEEAVDAPGVAVRLQRAVGARRDRGGRCRGATFPGGCRHGHGARLGHGVRVRFRGHASTSSRNRGDTSGSKLSLDVALRYAVSAVTLPCTTSSSNASSKRRIPTLWPI